MSVTVTLHAWWLLAYMAVGLVLWLPLEWVAWRSTHAREGFGSRLYQGLRGRPLVPLFTMLLWPLAIWEAVR